MKACKDCKHFSPGQVGGQATGTCKDPTKIVFAGEDRPMTKPPAVNPLHWCHNHEGKRG